MTRYEKTFDIVGRILLALMLVLTGIYFFTFYTPFMATVMFLLFGTLFSAIATGGFMFCLDIFVTGFATKMLMSRLQANYYG